MILKGIIDEDFVNYKVPSMTLMFPFCDFKCEADGSDYCHNSSLVNEENIEISVEDLCERYLNNPISEAIVCQGLEPFDSFNELFSFVITLRNMYDCKDDIVIYTGYNKDEIGNEVYSLSNYDNIIIKFGRFVPNQKSHYDNVLGVALSSDNQYAEKIS